MKKTCLITGGTSGIGYAIAEGLAEKGHNLILVGRSEQKGREVKEGLVRINSSPSVSYYNIDLSSQTEIRSVGERIKSDHPIIDVIINNAGVWTSRYECTVDNIEKQFAVNHLAYFLLTHILYSNVSKAHDGRIINMASDSHFWGKLHFEDPGLKNSYHGLKAYGQSKLANVLFTYHLHRTKKDDHVSVYCVQPGLVKTDIGVKHTNAFHSFMWKLRRLGGKSPKEAAETVVYLATSPEVKDKSGFYWDRFKPKPSSKSSYNEEDAQRLWKMSEEMCAISNYFS